MPPDEVPEAFVERATGGTAGGVPEHSSGIEFGWPKNRNVYPF